MEEVKYIVVVEDEYKPTVLFKGSIDYGSTIKECDKFIKDYPQICGNEAFIQEILE